MFAYCNGRFVPHEQAAIALADRGFVWGATVVDRCRTYGRRLFRWPAHLARFRRSCELCRIPQPKSDDELTRLAQELLDQNVAGAKPDAEFVVVLIATPGESEPNLVLIAEPFAGSRYRPLLSRGARLVSPAARHAPDECIPRQAKMRSRMFWWIAEQQARAIDPEASALLLDSDGLITETASANVAVYHDGVILTPPRSTVLDGISMRVVEELAASFGIPFREARLTLDDCYSADEMILTSTPFGVAGVSSLNGRPMRWPGPVLARMWSLWTEFVGIDIWRDILPAS